MNAVSKTSGIILALALGVHSFFEGIAFGLTPKISNAGQLAAGILIHKGAAVISLGGAFARTGYSLKAIALFLGIFSLTAPLGIIIGIIVSESNKLVDVVFLSISGGTFLYVACSEIIVNEFGRGYYRWAKVLFIMAGVSVISMLWLFDSPHEHSGDCEGELGEHAPHDGHGEVEEHAHEEEGGEHASDEEGGEHASDEEGEEHADEEEVKVPASDKEVKVPADEEEVKVPASDKAF